ncbi:MAG: hypothetical protein LBR77_06580 [Lachnospiraceae bacterium]|jgi:hypothetical protein|nr:hypothetical protein [Lachnospiraceae bacterium]
MYREWPGDGIGIHDSAAFRQVRLSEENLRGRKPAGLEAGGAGSRRGRKPVGREAAMAGHRTE